MIPLFRKKPTPFYRPPPQPTQTMNDAQQLNHAMRDFIPLGQPKLQFQLLHPDAKLPTRGSEHAAGLDLYCRQWQPFGDNMIQYDTGVAVAIPEGYVGLLFPRSSVTGTSLRLGNSVGVIDPDYRGSIMLKFDLLAHYSDSDRPYAEGDRIGQLVVVSAPRFEPVQVDELPATVRSGGGFGSTGR